MKVSNNGEMKDYLEAVESEMTFGEARAGVRIEIESHVQDRIEAAKSFGLSEADAVQTSLQRLGGPREIGRSLNQIHQPKFNLVLPALATRLCLIGLWNLSSSKWISLQLVWITLGASFLVLIYFLSAKTLKNVLASLYPLAVMFSLALPALSSHVRKLRLFGRTCLDCEVLKSAFASELFPT